jgi:hypothetical protein
MILPSMLGSGKGDYFAVEEGVTDIPGLLCFVHIVQHGLGCVNGACGCRLCPYEKEVCKSAHIEATLLSQAIGHPYVVRLLHCTTMIYQPRVFLPSIREEDLKHHQVYYLISNDASDSFHGQDYLVTPRVTW